MQCLLIKLIDRQYHIVFDSIGIKMSNWQKNIRKIVPYVAGEQPNRKDMVKLNTNENPYPPSELVKDTLGKLDIEKFRLYPDQEASILAEELSKYYEVDVKNIFTGVGSDDVLAIAFMAFFNSEKPILFPDITYSFYPVWADLYKVPYETKKLDKDFNIIKEDYCVENGGIIIANPNAPTSVLLALDEIEYIVKNNQDSIVIVDEAYIDFGGESAIPLTRKYDNLLVVQTFSKSRSMAGIRIGFAIGSEILMKAMRDIKHSINSYHLNLASIELGKAAVKDYKCFEDNCNKIIATREAAKLRLKELGFRFPDSKANFLFVTNDEFEAKEIYEYLRTKDIFVRYWDKPLIKDYLRITIGTNEQMERLYKALEDFIRNKKSA